MKHLYPPQRNEENIDTKVDARSVIFKIISHALGSERAVAFARTEFRDMHRYVLFIYCVTDFYLNKYTKYLSSETFIFYNVT